MAKETSYLLSEKEEWIAIDYFKIMCALLIVSIHYPIFASIDVGFSHYFNHVICRLAVPFFFISSGFFAAGKIDGKGICKYLKHVMLLYLVYNVLYIPQSFYHVSLEMVDKQLIIDTVKQFILVGGYMHLWYLIALGFAIAALKLMVSKLHLSDKSLIGIVVVLYFIGVMGNSYRDLLTGFGFEWIGQYYKIFATTRNGLFFGTPFVTAGYLIKKNSYRIKNIGYLKWSIVFLIFMFAEAGIVCSHYNSGEKDMMFFTMPAAICIFLTACFIVQNKEKRADLGKKCREISVMLFGLHILVHFYLNRYMIESGYYMIEHAGIRYILVVATTLIVSVTIIELSKRRPFKWMKILY